MTTQRLAIGQLWTFENGSVYRIVHLDRLRMVQGAISGVKLHTSSRRVRATLQADKHVRYGTKLVVYVSEKQPSGKHWVRPENEFLDGRFTRLDA